MRRPHPVRGHGKVRIERRLGIPITLAIVYCEIGRRAGLQPRPVGFPGHFLVKRVTNAGTFRFKRRLLFIANALKQHHIGLEEVDDGIWSIYFNRVLLARLDERDYVIRD